MRLMLALLLASAPLAVHATETPSFMQAGDVFCTSERDFDLFVTRGRIRARSATETCELTIQPTRVAILNGRAGTKTMIRVMAGANAFAIGWTNGTLPVQ